MKAKPQVSKVKYYKRRRSRKARCALS